MKPLFVDADIRKAETLPTSFYTDLNFFEASKTKIFEKSWQWIGDKDSLLSPVENMAPVEFLTPLIDEPMVVVRDEDNQIQCLSNVVLLLIRMFLFP